MDHSLVVLFPLQELFYTINHQLHMDDDLIKISHSDPEKLKKSAIAQSHEILSPGKLQKSQIEIKELMEKTRMFSDAELMKIAITDFNQICGEWRPGLMVLLPLLDFEMEKNPKILVYGFMFLPPLDLKWKNSKILVYGFMFLLPLLDLKWKRIIRFLPRNAAKAEPGVAQSYSAAVNWKIIL
ncbi:nucleotide exchange factor SIL1 [Trifolium repens]|nr:nucleotide exchange factor SIL1 [Trifolium repens]